MSQASVFIRASLRAGASEAQLLLEQGSRGTMAGLAFIMMEPGSEWPGHVGNTENVVVVGHREVALLDEARQRLEALRARGQQVRVGVLACNEATDPKSIAGTTEVAEALLAAISSTNFGKLVLSSRDRASNEKRRALLALAGSLTEKARGKSVTVSVRFMAGDRPETSERRSPSIHRASARGEVSSRYGRKDVTADSRR